MIWPFPHWVDLTLILSGCVLICLAVYFSLIMYDAKHDVENAPRTDMYLCQKHGAFPKKHVMLLSGVTENPIEQCPFCYEDKFKQVKTK